MFRPFYQAGINSPKNLSRQSQTTTLLLFYIIPCCYHFLSFPEKQKTKKSKK